MEQTEQRIRKRDVILGLGKLIGMDIRKYPLSTLGILGIMGMAVYMVTVSGPNNARIRRYETELTKSLSVLADNLGNSDNATTSDEWARLYLNNGMRYDSHYSDPHTDFTTQQKEAILKEMSTN